MYKRLLYTLLTIVTVAAFAACGSSASETDADDSKTKTEASDKSLDDDDAKDEKEEKDEETKDIASLFDKLEERFNDGKADTSEWEGTSADSATDTDDTDTDWYDWDDNYGYDETSLAIVENTDGIIVDNEICSFQILSAQEDSSGYTLSLQCESKADKNLAYAFEQVYVNNVYCNPIWVDSVGAGETLVDDVLFYNSDLEALGITEVTSITFWLTITDDDTWDTIVEGIYTYYPNGKENAVVYDYSVTPESSVLLEQDGLFMAITGYEYDNYGDLAIHVYLENNSDTHYDFEIKNLSLNGLLCDPYWDATLLSGMKACDVLYFSSYILNAHQITLPATDLSFDLVVTDYDEYDPAFENTYVLYPSGEEASQPFEFTPSDTDIVLFDNEECSMIITDCILDNYGDFQMIVYLENKSDTELGFQSYSSKLNGYNCSASMIEILGPKQKCFTSLDWFSFEMEPYGITTIESVELPVTVTDYSIWESILEETFTITP